MAIGDVQTCYPYGPYYTPNPTVYYFPTPATTYVYPFTCDKCGAALNDQAKHDEWHVANDKKPRKRPTGA